MLTHLLLIHFGLPMLIDGIANQLDFRSGPSPFR